MFPFINANYPRSALKFFLSQAGQLNPLQTRQQEIVVTCSDAATIAAWNLANPHCSLELTETETMYPFGGIVFWMLQVADYVPPANDAGAVYLTAQLGWTAAQVSTGCQAQINAYAAAMRTVTNGYYDSLKAVPYAGFPNAFLLRMPIGTNGGPVTETDVGPVVSSLRWQGVTVPLAPGIIGPRRHIFAVPYPQPRGGIG
jgi:hypothetical protein